MTENETIMIDKTEADIEQNKLLKADYEDRISALNDVLKLIEDKISVAYREIEIKQKSPLKIDAEYDFEQLPEWEEHMKEVWRLSILTEIMNLRVELKDTRNRINQYIKMVEELGV
jgi:hypothetical protein